MNDELVLKIQAVIALTGKNPGIIAMNPNTFDQLLNELPINVPKPDDIAYDLEYMGIKVVRSFDVKEGIFEVN